MLFEMAELSFIILIYSLVVFTIIFIYGLVIFFKLKKNERAISDVRRKLDALLQNADSKLPENNYQHNQGATAIQDSILDNHELETEKEMSFKNAIKNSKRHLSLETNSYQSEKEIKVDAKLKKEENLKSSVNSEDLKDKIIDMLDQFDNPISYEIFSSGLNEDSSFAGQHHLVFDLIDQLVDENKIEVHFVGGRLLINLK